MSTLKKLIAVKHILLLDAVLLALCVWLGFHLRQQWAANASRYQVSKIVAPSEAIQKVLAMQKSTLDLQKNYLVIASRNLFSPDRNDVVAPAEQQKPRPPKPILYGILNLKEAKLAMMSSPDRRNYASLKVGDHFGEYTLSKILVSSVELKWGDDTVMATTEEQPKNLEPQISTAASGAGGKVVTVDSGGAALAGGSSNAAHVVPSQPGQTAPPVCKGKIVNTPFGQKCVEE